VVGRRRVGGRQHDGLLDLFVVNYLAWTSIRKSKCESSPGVLD